MEMLWAYTLFEDRCEIKTKSWHLKGVTKGKQLSCRVSPKDGIYSNDDDDDKITVVL